MEFRGFNTTQESSASGMSLNNSDSAFLKLFLTIHLKNRGRARVSDVLEVAITGLGETVVKI